MKKFSKFLKTWDGIWSIPLAIFFFIAIGYLISMFFGPESGEMAPVYIQRLFYASLASVVCNFVVLLGMYINWKELFDKYQTGLGGYFDEVSPKDKLKVILAIYFLYSLIFVFFFAFI